MRKLLFSLLFVSGIAAAQQISPNQIDWAVPIPSSVTFTNPITSPNINQVRVVDGVTYMTIQQAINSFGAPGNCGIVFLPQGTYITNITLNTSNTCSNPSNYLIIRGAGIVNTVLKPATNACVITIDSTAGPVQNVQIEDLGFSNAGTGFSGLNNNAICITGNNINDHHLFRRIGANFFNSAVSITGRCIWCTFENAEFHSSTGIPFTVQNNAGSGLVGLLTLNQVDIEGGVGPCAYINTSSNTNTGVAIRDSTMQQCTNEGLRIANIDGLDVANSDFEANGSAGAYDNIWLGGTWARGFHIHGNHILASTTGSGIHVAATQVGGDIGSNFISAIASTIYVDSSVSSGLVSADCNFEAGTHAISGDRNNTYHFTDNCAKSYAPTTLNSSGSLTPGVSQISALYMTNTAAATITNFTNGEAGQILTLYNSGSSTVALTNSSANGLSLPNGQGLTLNAGQSCQFFFSPVNSLWVAYGCTVNVPIPASLTTTSATSDNVTVTGMTSSGHCSIAATNASAATNITTTYISAFATNQITVTHAAMAGMNYQFICISD